MRTLNVPMDDEEYDRIIQAKEKEEKREGRPISWREFLVRLIA